LTDPKAYALTTRFANPARQLPRPANPGPANSGAAPKRLLLSAIAVTGVFLLTAYGLHLVSTTALVAAPTALFRTVYLGAMTAALRVLRGATRLAAIPGALAVLIMLAFCGRAIAIPAAVILITARSGRPKVRHLVKTAPPDPVACSGQTARPELAASR
jgi:hypothetical protein